MFSIKFVYAIAASIVQFGHPFGIVSILHGKNYAAFLFSFLFILHFSSTSKWLSSKPPRTTNGYDLCCWMKHPSHSHKNRRYLMWHFQSSKFMLLCKVFTVHSSHTPNNQSKKNSYKQNKWFLYFNYCC